MKKKILSFITLLCMITALLPTNITVFASTVDSGTCGDNLTWMLDDSGTLTIRGNGDMTGLTSNNMAWYSLKSSIKAVVIGDDVTSICDYAFDSCRNLTTVKIGSNVKTIGYEAFDDSPHISAITIPDSVESIGQYAFEDCYDISVVTIGKGLKSIGRGAFRYNETSEYIIDSENPYFQAIEGNIFNKDGTVLVRYAIGKSETSYTVPDGVTTIANYAFESATSLKNITIPKTVTRVAERAFLLVDSYNNKYYLKNVYYNGTEEEWGNITISYDNSFMTEATKIYFAYINIFDKDGNKVVDTTQNMGETVDVSSITVPDRYAIKLYKDQALTAEYSLDTPISENLNLYYDIIELNKLKITGAESADIGKKGITESVTFATDKMANGLVANIKYSSDLSLSEVKSDVFDINKVEYTDNGYNYLYLTCTYKEDENIPINTEIKAFDLIFGVSENAKPNDILTIEFVSDDTYLTDGNNGYNFESFETAEIKINPIFVDNITINGEDEIDKITQYTAVILPENATNNEVEWSVDNGEIATISTDGTLTPIKAGTVKIKATAKDGSGAYGKKSVNVKVYAQITSLTVSSGVWDKEFIPSEREYTIYIPKNTSIIRLKPQYSTDGALKNGTTRLTNNQNNIIPLTGDETILTLTYSQTGYTDSEYKITIVKFEGTKTTVSDDGKTFTVKPINIANGNTVILALYNGNSFVGMEAPQIYNVEEKLTFTTNKTYTNAKIMVWDSLDGMQPQCEAEEVKKE